MTGTGTVKEIRGEYIEVVAPREAECSSCSLRGSCGNNSLRGGQAILVKNTVNAQVGDYVEFEFNESELNRAFFIAYGIPLISIVVGVAVGAILEAQYKIRLFNLKNSTTLIFTMVFIGIGVAISNFLDRRQKPTSYTTRILSRELVA